MPTKFVSNGELRRLLERASVEERLALTNVLHPKAATALNAVELQQQICLAGGHGVANWLRGQGNGYVDIVRDVALALKIPDMPSYTGGKTFYGASLWKWDELSIIKTENRDLKECRCRGLEFVEEAETKILLKLLELTYSKLGPAEREAFDNRLRDVAARFGERSTKGLAGAAGLLVIGNLGGFATFTLMSTVLSTISLGTLGFGAYTAASSALGLILGPVGWIALGFAGVHVLGKPSLKTTIPLVAQIAMLRQRIQMGRAGYQ